jgi:hypothetical protein
MRKNSYEIPKTNAEGLALVWTRIYPAELARQLGISRAAATKWKAVPLERVNVVAEITKIPRKHILPEVYATS